MWQGPCRVRTLMLSSPPSSRVIALQPFFVRRAVGQNRRETVGPIYQGSGTTAVAPAAAVMREAVGLHDDGARHGEPPRSGPQVADDFGTDDKPLAVRTAPVAT